MDQVDTVESVDYEHLSGQKRLGSSSASSGGLGIKGPSPRMTPRSASASDARRHGSNGAAIAVGVPPSLPLLRQEA